MATIRQRGNGYFIEVFCGVDINGKKKRVFTTFVPTEKTPAKIRDEVKKYAMDFEDRVKKGEYYSGERMTFAEFLPLWERDYGTEHLTSSILSGYKRQLELHFIPAIGNMKMNEVKARHLNKIFASMKESGLSDGSVRRNRAIASCVFKQAYMDEIIQENPCSRVKPPKSIDRRELNCFTPEQAEIFLHQALHKPFTTKFSSRTRTEKNGNITNIREYTETNEMQFQFVVFFTVSLYSGCRRGELIALTWNDVDFETKSISITKSATLDLNGKGQTAKSPKTQSGYRKISLPDECMTLLRKWHVQQKELALMFGEGWKGTAGTSFDDNFVFIQENGAQMHLSTPTAKFKKIIENYNKDVDEADRLPLIRLHDLRHTSASLLIASKLDPVTVSHRLGHSKTSITLDIYSHAFEKLDEQASNTLSELLKKKA